MTGMYVVVTYNQASHRPELEGTEVYHDAREAEEARDRARAATAKVSRREHHVVMELHEVDL